MPRVNSTIFKLQAQYESFVHATTSEETSMRYSRALDTFFDAFPDKNEPGDWSRMDVDDYRARRRKKGIGAKTVNYEIQIVRAFWNWMIAMECATFNPASGIKRLRQLEPVRQSLSIEKQELLYEVCLNDNERLLVGLALTEGLRCKTLHLLDTTDFNFERKILLIPPTKIKNQRGLELPVRDRELKLVQALPPGNLWGDWAKTTKALSRRWDLVCQRAGITGMKGLRTARRTCATTLLRNGYDLRLVQTLLGHADISTTSKYLTPAIRTELADALASLPGAP